MAFVLSLVVVVLYASLFVVTLYVWANVFVQLQSPQEGDWTLTHKAQVGMCIGWSIATLISWLIDGSSGGFIIGLIFKFVVTRQFQTIGKMKVLGPRHLRRYHWS